MDGDADGPLSRLMTLLLIGLYGWAWGSATLDASAAMAKLAWMSALLTAPFFLLTFFKNMLGGKIVMLFLVLIGSFVPFLQFLVWFWLLATLVMKLGAFYRNLPFILIGLGFYLLVLLVPGFLYGIFIHLGFNASIAMIVIGLAGTALFCLFLRWIMARGLQPALPAALALGATCYCLLFIISVLIPGHPGDMDHTA